MYEASGDGILETKELEKWNNKHYTKFLIYLKGLIKLKQKIKAR